MRIKNVLARRIRRLLIVCLLALPCGAHAGMVDTDELLAPVPAAAARERLRDMLARSDVSRQLQALGVSASAARERVNAMTDAEVASVSGRIDRLPAGGVSGAAVLVGLVAIEVIWYFWVK